jgi:CHASE3 domain sensor protein
LNSLYLGIVIGVVVFIVLSGVLCWKVRAYDEKYKELTQHEVEIFKAGDPGSINNELGLDDQVI